MGAASALTIGNAGDARMPMAHSHQQASQDAGGSALE